ncbi:MAG: hypothetical protein V3S84_02975 [Dehalococcoidales bacterium]
MKFLKGLAISLLSFILFLSLGVFGTVYMLNNTLLNPDFVSAQIDKIPVSSLIREMTEEQIGEQVPEEARFLEEAMYNAIAENEPWLKEQVNAGIYSFYDFLLGKSERLSMIISLEPLKEGLRDSLWQAFMQDLPPELSALPPAQIEQYFNQYSQEFSAQIPTEIRFDESQIPPEVMAQLLQARQYIGYAQTYYYPFIGFMVLLVILIILLHRSVKGATRGLGITFLIYGAIEYASIWAAGYFGPTYLPLVEIPSSLQMWLTGFINDLLAPLQTFGIGLMAAGAALIIVSIVYPRLRPVEEEQISESGGY